MPLLDLLSMSPFREETDHTCGEALRHLSVAENLLKACEQGLVDLVLVSGEEGSG